MSKQSFTTGQVLTAAQVNSLQANDFNQTVSVKTANYTLAAADKGTRIEFNTSGSVTCTVNSGLFDAGDTLVIQNRGAGTATITAGTATVNTSASLALAQYSAGTLYFVSDSAALFFGDAAGISASIVDAKGDLIVGTADNTVARLAVGTNGHTLVADSVETTGLKWAAPAGSSGPAFKATGTTGQTLTQNTWVKAELGTETFDTDSCYDPTTNYRFTPNKAGYYSFQTTARITHGDATAYYQYGIYKNGVLENLLIIVTAQTNGSTYAASNLIYFNGTTDYAEFYVYTGASALQTLDRPNTFFSGVWIRS